MSGLSARTKPQAPTDRCIVQYSGCMRRRDRNIGFGLQSSNYRIISRLRLKFHRLTATVADTRGFLLASKSKTPRTNSEAEARMTKLSTRSNSLVNWSTACCASRFCSPIREEPGTFRPRPHAALLVMVCSRTHRAASAGSISISAWLPPFGPLTFGNSSGSRSYPRHPDLCYAVTLNRLSVGRRK